MAAIDARQRELSDWIFDIWKFPNEAVPTPREGSVASVAPGGEAPRDGEPESPDTLPEVPEG